MKSGKTCTSFMYIYICLYTVKKTANQRIVMYFNVMEEVNQTKLRYENIRPVYLQFFCEPNMRVLISPDPKITCLAHIYYTGNHFILC